MSLERFAAVTSTNAAKIFGLYPRKGALAPGSDVVLIDPSIQKTLTRDDFHVSDYSPWEGWNVAGWPVLTILRGAVVVADGKLAGARGGQLVARKIDPAVLQRAVC
jgi:dihydropyrimidinase